MASNCKKPAYRHTELTVVMFSLQLIKTVKAKIGMRSDAECFALYEVTSGTSGNNL